MPKLNQSAPYSATFSDADWSRGRDAAISGVLAFSSTGRRRVMPNPIMLPLLRWAGKLRYPTLFKVTAALFVASVLIPDPIPFLDEIVFGLGTLLLANWKTRAPAAPEPIPARARRGRR